MNSHHQMFSYIILPSKITLMLVKACLRCTGLITLGHWSFHFRGLIFINCSDPPTPHPPISRMKARLQPSGCQLDLGAVLWLCGASRRGECCTIRAFFWVRPRGVIGLMQEVMSMLMGVRGEGNRDKFRRKRETLVQWRRRWKETGKVRQCQTEPERKKEREREKETDQNWKSIIL